MAEKSIKTITFSGTKEGHQSWEFMMNLKTGRLCLSRDERWINKTYGEYLSLDIREVRGRRSQQS
jgi:hypothetical protein